MCVYSAAASFLFELASDFVCKALLFLLDSFAELVSDETAYHGTLQDVLHLELAVRVFDEDLLQEARVTIELLHLAVHDLRNNVGRLARFPGLRLVDRPLPLERLSRDRLP